MKEEDVKTYNFEQFKGVRLRKTIDLAKINTSYFDVIRELKRVGWSVGAICKLTHLGLYHYHIEEILNKPNA